MSQKRKACLAIGLYFASAKEPKRPRWAKEWYLKREEFTSENLLRELKLSEPRVFILSKTNYEFIMVDVGANGRMSDGAVITNTKLG